MINGIIVSVALLMCFMIDGAWLYMKIANVNDVRSGIETIGCFFIFFLAIVIEVVIAYALIYG